MSKHHHIPRLQRNKLLSPITGRNQLEGVGSPSISCSEAAFFFLTVPGNLNEEGLCFSLKCKGTWFNHSAKGGCCEKTGSCLNPTLSLWFMCNVLQEIMRKVSKYIAPRQPKHMVQAFKQEWSNWALGSVVFFTEDGFPIIHTFFCEQLRDKV